MKKSILFLLLIASISVNAQNISNNLTGYFKTNNEDALYTSIHLNGNGHALISDGFSAEYFQKDDTLYVFPDKSVFIFKIEKDKLKGISEWVDKQTYKSSKVPTNDDYERNFNTYNIDPNLLYQFYQKNFIEGTDQISWEAFENEQAYNSKMKELCEKGLTTACGALFGMEMLKGYGGLDGLINNETTIQKPNENIEKIAQKMIDAGDNRGYGLLGSYFYSIGNIIKAKEIYTEGSEKGDTQSALILFSISIDETYEEEYDVEVDE